jgi:hypothetical protein
MHARSHASGTALCGATGKLAWSLDPDAVTCPKCRATLLMLGEPLRPRREEPLVTPICLHTVDAGDPPAPPAWKTPEPGAKTRRPGAARRAPTTPRREATPRPRKRR